MYKIIGVNRFFQKEIYWQGENKKECMDYLNYLKTRTALNTVRFKFIEQ